jgi:peroxiredoxin (alkyl hydroperoxide reductase subunit C)
MPLGRNIDEVLRLVDALQYSEEHGEVCPAGWKKGDTAMQETQESVSDYLGKL